MVSEDEKLTLEGQQFVQAEASTPTENGWGKLELERGDGTLFSDTRPGGSYYTPSMDVSSEAAPGDCSGRWYITLTMCGSCSGGASAATFTLTVNIRSMADRQLLLGQDLAKLSLMGSQQRMYLVDPMRDPLVHGAIVSQNWTQLNRPIRVDVRSSNESAPVYIKLWLGWTTASQSSWAQCPSSSSLYDVHCSLRSGVLAESTNGFFPQPAATRPQFALVQGCSGCSPENEGTVYTGTIGASLEPKPRPILLASGAAPLQYDLSGGQYSYFRANLDGTSSKLVVVVANQTVSTYYKIVARKGALPTYSTNDAEAPTGSNYDGNPSLTLSNPADSPSGTWYIGVLQCSGCGNNGNNGISNFTIEAIET